MSVMQESRSIMKNKSADVIQYPHIKADGTPDLRYGSKKKTGIRVKLALDEYSQLAEIQAI